MAVYQITVESEFCASHALRLPDGSDEPLHGHNWRVAVTVGSADLDAMEAVMDFHDLERALAGVLGPWHNRHLNDAEPFSGGRVNPTAERVAGWIARRIAEALPAGVAVESVTVTEAPRCRATYRP